MNHYRTEHPPNGKKQIQPFLNTLNLSGKRDTYNLEITKPVRILENSRLENITAF